MPLTAGVNHNSADFVAHGSELPLHIRRMNDRQKIHGPRNQRRQHSGFVKHQNSEGRVRHRFRETTEKRQPHIRGIRFNDERLFRDRVIKPGLPLLTMIFNRRFKKRRHHRGLRHHRPVVPTAFQRSDVLRGLPQFLHQPRLCGERLFEPLL